MKVTYDAKGVNKRKRAAFLSFRQVRVAAACSFYAISAAKTGVSPKYRIPRQLAIRKSYLLFGYPPLTELPG